MYLKRKWRLWCVEYLALYKINTFTFNVLCGCWAGENSMVVWEWNSLRYSLKKIAWLNKIPCEKRTDGFKENYGKENHYYNTTRKETINKTNIRLEEDSNDMVKNSQRNEMKCRCFGPLFLRYEGWIGPGTAWANEVKFLWNLPQSSIDPSTLDSESNAVSMKWQEKKMKWNEMKMF